MVSLRLAIGCALAAALSACTGTSPLSPVDDAITPPNTSTLPWPESVKSAAGCDLHLQGIVVIRMSDAPVADATVNWRHAEGAFDVVDEIRSDSNGRFSVCVPTPPSVCDSGACRLQYEVRVTKPGYTADSTSVVVDYNYWWINFFRISDLQMTLE